MSTHDRVPGEPTTVPPGNAPADAPASVTAEHGDLRSAVPAEERADAQAHDFPLIHEEEAGAVPLGRRIRDPRTIISFVVPIAVLALLVVALPGFHLEELPGLIAQANPALLLAALGIYYLGFPLRGYRWAILVRGIGYPLKVKDSTEIIFISWLVNCVVPAKLGDVYRAYLLRVNYRVSLSRAFGTIFIERVFDLIAIVSLGLLAGFWSFRTGLSPEVQTIFAIGVVVVLVLLLGLLLVRNFGRLILERLPVPARVVQLYDAFEEGVFSVDRRSLPVVLVVTCAIWMTEALRLYFVIAALGFDDVTVGISGAVFIALIASLLTAVPLTPAGLGLVEVGIVGVLGAVYGVPQTEALAIALVDRAISVLSVIFFGSIVYIVSPKTKGRVAPEVAAADAAAAAAAVAAGAPASPSARDTRA